METVRANGVELAYLSAGAGPLVVLVHGFPDTARSWDRTLDAVAAAGYRAVAPFTRGYPPSSIPTDGRYDGETLGRDVLGLIEALGAENAVVVGHDWGAVAGYCAAALEPSRVRLLVPMAIPHPAAMRPSPSLLWKVRHFATLRGPKGPVRLRANHFALVDELWRRWSPGWKQIPASETADVKRVLAAPGAAEAACAYYSALRLRLPDPLRRRISVPTVAFAGEHDVVAPRAYEKARHHFTSSYEVVIVPGGHFMHREHPDAFHRELVQTLSDKAPA